MNITQLLNEMYPAGIPPTEYARIVTLITRVGVTGSPPPRTQAPVERVTYVPRPPPARKRKTSTPGARLGRPPTGTAVKDRMIDLLQSRREGMTVNDLSEALDAHATSIYTAVKQIGAERVDEGGQSVIRLPAAISAPAPL